MAIRLYMFTGSNAVLTAQLMLAHKGLDYEAVNLPPGVHAVALRLLGFPRTTVPAINAEGRKVQGTRNISRALDEMEPNPPLFPADPEARREVETAEREGEAFADEARRIFYAVGRRDPDAFRNVIVGGQPRVSAAIYGRIAPQVIRLASLKHKATDERGRRDIAALPARLDQIDAWIEQGVLNGPQLNAADFQFGVNLAALLGSGDGAPFIRGRPAEALADRVAPGYTAVVGSPLPPGGIPPALPAGWLEEARRA